MVILSLCYVYCFFDNSSLRFMFYYWNSCLRNLLFPLDPLRGWDIFYCSKWDKLYQIGGAYHNTKCVWLLSLNPLRYLSLFFDIAIMLFSFCLYGSCQYMIYGTHGQNGNGIFLSIKQSNKHNYAKNIKATGEEKKEKRISSLASISMYFLSSL